MSKLDKLDKLYQTVSNCEDLKLDLPDGVVDQISDLEEQLIKDVILPLIHDNIEPTLRRVKRPLVLVVEYDPDGSLRVNLSRKINLSAQIADAKQLELDPVVKHNDVGPQKCQIRKKASPTKIRVYMPNGRIIESATGKETFAEFVKIVGPQRVRSLNLTCDNGPLVTNRIDTRYRKDFEELGWGLYLNTHSNNATKIKYIEKIAYFLGIKAKACIIE